MIREYDFENNEFFISKIWNKSGSEIEVEIKYIILSNPAKEKCQTKYGILILMQTVLN